MKPISQLGLNIIELEDQVLLVKHGDTPKNWYLDDTNQIRESITDDPDWWSARLGYRSILSSTKPIEGLPLLIIEDEVDKLFFEELAKETPQNYDQSLLEATKHGFKYGYNKAKEIYKFTEEDMGDLIEICIGLQEEWRLIKQIDAIQRFNKTHKKELWIDVEAHCIACDKYYNKSNRCKQVKGETSICYLRLDSIPKIVNNQIKATYR